MESTLVLFGMIWFLLGTAHAEDMSIDLGENNPSVHFLLRGEVVKIEPAFEDYGFMLEDACEAMELTGDDCLIYPMMGDIHLNAVASMLDGNRIIIYDRRMSPEVGYEGAMTIIAHELGHHYCGHLGQPSGPSVELEADRFAGAAMKKAGYELEAALAVIPVLDERPSKSHPARADRIAAITDGWENPAHGKDCKRR